MAPKKKKSKVVSNRGFATVSVPRKVDPVEEAAAVAAAEVEAAAAAAPKTSVAAAAKGDALTEGAKKDGGASKEDEWDGDMMERHELQNLSEKIRTGCDKEVSRITKVIDYERRIAKSLPGYSWTEQDLVRTEQDLQRRILALAKTSVDEECPLPVYETEDKVVAKVATLWGILKQLGFTKERIEECLRAVRALELDDVLDWLFLHCEQEELACEGPIVAAHVYTESAPPTPRVEQPNGFNFQSPTSTPARSTIASPHNGTSPADEASVEASLRARILAYDDEVEKEVSMEENADANTTYAGIKLQMSEIQRAQGAAKRAAKGRGKGVTQVSAEQEEWREMQVEVLKKKLKAIEGDYTFRKVDAEKLYREERTKLDVSQLSARLNGTGLDTPPSEPTSLTAAAEIISSAPSADVDGADPSTDASVPATPTPDPGSSATDSTAATNSPETPSAAADKASEAGAAEDQDSLFGNLLDEMPSTETNDHGSTVPVRDMALPKHYSGKTPKANLEETVRKMDKYATVVFKVISRSRAVRASVCIRWDGGRTQTWEMQETACYDQKQAYDYVATVALFAVSSTAVNKQLPLIFRDLWDELVLKKKEEDDELYRQQLKVFKAIAEPRLQPPPSRDPRVSKAQTSSTAEASLQSRQEVPLETQQRIQEELAIRQSWPTYQEMLRQRANLPIAAYRSHIMSTIEDNQCVVLCGETGCGKSTQVPSFILEHDMRKGRPVKIFCTEPRRISAISLAQRVSSELGEPANSCGTRASLVGYSIRLDSMVSASSRIVYATTGIVLRMLEGRESLSDCTHIIIDEVHERSIDSDFLLIILRQILETRKDLKVILMSATVDAEKIAAYMGNNTPVITVPGRTFPVTAHFLEDVVELTRYRLDPHTDSPYVAKKMRNYGGRASKASSSDDMPPDDDDEQDSGPGNSAVNKPNLSKQSQITLDCLDHHAINYDLIVLLLENLCFYKAELVPFSAAILIFLPSLESIRRLTDTLESHQAFGSNQFLVLPLHSTISNENQGLVFNVPRPGVRKIVISTNLAETGVTIPDITAVIDTGKHREMRFDEKRQISRLVETFVAQSNASQRRGRAGRVREGICFHLFTKHRHDTMMAEHPQPEMLRLSLQDLALRIKIMKIGTSAIEDVLLRALDPPLQVNIQRAVSSLVEAKAITTTEEITPLGRHLAKLPMDVHLGKFLIMACIFNCLDAALTITATLNSKSPWLTPFGRESEADAVKRGFKVENSDFLTTYNAYCSWREASGNGYEREFCRKSFLSQQNLQMIEELRQQYFSFLVDAGFIQITEAQKRDLISTRYGKSRTRFVRVPDELDTHSKDPKAVMACLAASLYPKLLVIDPQSGQMRTLTNSAPAAIHPSSVNFAPGRRIDFGNAKFIAFFTAMHTKKLYVWESGSVDERAVYLLCGNADFQLAAHSLAIDRKIKTRLEPKTSMAMKVLRQKWNSYFLARMRNPGAVPDPLQLEWLELVKEALVSPKKDEEVHKSKKEPVKIKLSVVRNS